MNQGTFLFINFFFKGVCWGDYTVIGIKYNLIKQISKPNEILTLKKGNKTHIHSHMHISMYIHTPKYTYCRYGGRYDSS